jgi:hypothetical protein
MMVLCQAAISDSWCSRRNGSATRIGLRMPSGSSNGGAGTDVYQRRLCLTDGVGGVTQRGYLSGAEPSARALLAATGGPFDNAAHPFDRRMWCGQDGHGEALPHGSGCPGGREMRQHDRVAMREFRGAFCH